MLILLDLSRLLRHHGIGKLNENGHRLLEFCCFHYLCVTNTYFQNKDRHKESWRHPRSNQCHQLDLVITRAGSINNVCNTRAYHSTDCDTDHLLVASWVKVTPKSKANHVREQPQSAEPPSAESRPQSGPTNRAVVPATTGSGCQAASRWPPGPVTSGSCMRASNRQQESQRRGRRYSSLRLEMSSKTRTNR